MKKMSSSVIGLFKYKMLLIGMVNILVLSGMLGIQGAGYFGITLAVAALFISFHSLWLSSVVARYVRGRNARNQYRSSRMFLRGALLYVIITGAVFSAVFILFSDRIGSFLVRDIHISICFMAIAGLLPVCGISEAVSGYLQGMGFHTPVKIFLLARQITAFAGSIAGMKLLREYGEKVASLKHNASVSSVYAAFGSLLGVLAGCITGLAVLLIFCLLLHGEMRYMRSKDNARYQEGASRGLLVMCNLGILQGIRYAMLFSPILLNYILYVRLCRKDGDSAPWIKVGGFLFGEAVPVMAALLLSFLILQHKNYRQLAGHWKNEAYTQFREKVFAMLLGVFVFALPICAGVSVMAEPLLKCLTKEASKEGSGILLFAAAGAVLLILEWIAYKLMELWNEVPHLFLTVLVSFGVQTVFVIAGFKGLDFGVNGIVFGMLLQTLLFVVFFSIKCFRRLKLTGNQVKKLIMAMILALAGALIMLLIYQAAGKKLSAGAAIAVSGIPGFLVYLAAVIVLQIVSDKDAEYMPGGGLFLRINRMLGR